MIDEPIIADHFKGEIEFKNVYFKYKEDGNWIINNVSFHIKPGETVAFVGPTGAGKTTILSLLMRYYDVDDGEILIDGVNVKYYDIHSLRKNIGEMLQDVFLFTGSIKNNITLRDESISDEDIIQSSKYVNADSFINELPNKYEEQVKERGNNYSQGQRQLLSFARTIVHNPKMIILDEATSNIDTETEVLIQDSLEKIKSIGTTIMVAHRLSTIQHSDIIMFLDHGEIVESGSHKELLALKGRYYQLYQLQYDSKEKRH
jgi:ATP-binding cassette subfamily B protein